MKPMTGPNKAFGKPIRYAKALIIVGDDKDMRDRALGQRLELIVNGAPWRLDAQSVTVQARGASLAGRLLHLP